MSSPVLCQSAVKTVKLVIEQISWGTDRHSWRENTSALCGIQQLMTVFTITVFFLSLYFHSNRHAIVDLSET